MKKQENVIRCTSSVSSTSSTNEICRICHCEAEKDDPLISPCVCSGSLMYIHQACLQKWIKATDTKSCELCKFEFHIDAEMKPINKVFAFLHSPVCTIVNLINSVLVVPSQTIYRYDLSKH